jgi:2-methylisocitrate lyase-like PEP mutase family enzyme
VAWIALRPVPARFPAFYDVLHAVQASCPSHQFSGTRAPCAAAALITAAERAVLASAAQELLAAHHGSRPAVLANIWDAASAVIVEEAGFPFTATSSRGIAAALGERDDDSSDPDVIFDHLRRIARAVRGPVTADLEAGYRLSPPDLVRRLLEAGCVGCNLEDTDHHGGGVLIDSDRQAAFIAAVRAAADAAGVHIVINARVDTFARRVGDDQEQLAEAIRRGRSYLAAGADCVYPIMAVDRDQIRELAERIPGPINILARRGGPLIAELAALGVRRISMASGLHQMTGALLRSAAHRLALGAELADVWPPAG